jgi:hypothetical protein
MADKTPAHAKDVLPKDYAEDTVARGDHLSTDLEGTYKDNPDKPAPESIAQIQEVPEGWPTGQRTAP